MTNTKSICFVIVIIFFATLINMGCKNHIDKYEVNVDSLKTLPDNSYGYRGGAVYVTDIKTKNYMIWFNYDDNHNIQNIIRINNFKNKYIEEAIDTLLEKRYAQVFINLSRKYKFGHIHIDRKNIISISCKEDGTEFYVKTFNDSVKHEYEISKEFKLLQNGWFKKVEK